MSGLDEPRQKKDEMQTGYRHFVVVLVNTVCVCQYSGTSPPPHLSRSLSLSRAHLHVVGLLWFMFQPVGWLSDLTPGFHTKWYRRELMIR